MTNDRAICQRVLNAIRHFYRLCPAIAVVTSHPDTNIRIFFPGAAEPCRDKAVRSFFDRGRMTFLERGVFINELHTNNARAIVRTRRRRIGVEDRERAEQERYYESGHLCHSEAIKLDAERDQSFSEEQF